MPSILAVDIGTTSAKALVITDHGKVLASAKEYYPTHRPQPDFAEQAPEEIFRAVQMIIRKVATAVEGRVDAVCFSSAMHSVLAVAENGEALTPLMLWSDLRATAEAKELRISPGQRLYEETGTPIHPMSPACKIAWLKKNQSDIFAKAFKFIGIKEYCWFKIFGVFVVDQSIASATGLFSTQTRSWSSMALESTHIDAGRLSTPCSIYTSFKIEDKQIAIEMGLSGDIPWIIGASDGCLANLGSNVMDSSVLSLTIGTSGAVRKTVTTNFPDAYGRTFHYLLDENTLVTGGATNNGAILLQWFAEKFLKQSIDITSFCEQAATVNVGAQGLIFLPFLLGERAPVFDPDASGVFFGARYHHTSQHFMRAILEGIGYALLSIAEIVEKNSGGYDRVMASGGFIVSPVWVQIMADIFGRNVHVQATDDASAVGAALIGFRAIGSTPLFEFPEEKVFQPDPARHTLYQKYFSVYKDLYPHLSADFQLLNSITQH